MQKEIFKKKNRRGSLSATSAQLVNTSFQIGNLRPSKGVEKHVMIPTPKVIHCRCNPQVYKSFI